jgi:hypothetical protein
LGETEEGVGAAQADAAKPTVNTNSHKTQARPRPGAAKGMRRADFRFIGDLQ